MGTVAVSILKLSPKSSPSNACSPRSAPSSAALPRSRISSFPPRYFQGFEPGKPHLQRRNPPRTLRRWRRWRMGWLGAGAIQADSGNDGGLGFGTLRPAGKRLFVRCHPEPGRRQSVSHRCRTLGNLLQPLLDHQPEDGVPGEAKDKEKRIFCSINVGFSPKLPRKPRH